MAEASNHSTGYCPHEDSWPAVARALDRIGIAHPTDFTHRVVFRRCTVCKQVNVVRDHHYACVFCDHDLPAAWNITS